MVWGQKVELPASWSSFLVIICSIYSSPISRHVCIQRNLYTIDHFPRSSDLVCGVCMYVHLRIYVYACACSYICSTQRTHVKQSVGVLNLTSLVQCLRLESKVTSSSDNLWFFFPICKFIANLWSLNQPTEQICFKMWNSLPPWVWASSLVGSCRNTQ